VGKVKCRLFAKNQPERIAIFGLGGIGKTQIALELAYQTRELYPDCAIFWLPAVDTESLQQAYQRVADQLGIALGDTREDVMRLVKDHLSRSSTGRWLLIFDNADEIDMWSESQISTTGGLKDYLPTSNEGAIVFTTRSNKVAQYLAETEVIEIAEMDEQKTTRVLRNTLISKELLHDTESTRKLLSRLTFLPLAIVQAASFINENRLTLASYVDLLDRTITEDPHPARTCFLHKVGRCQTWDGRAKEAERIFIESIEIAGVLYGPDSPYALFGDYELVHSYLGQGKLKEGV